MVKMTEEPEDFEGRWPDMDRACDAFEAADCPGDRGRGNLEIKLLAALAVLHPPADEVQRLRAEVEALKLQRTAAELVHRETATTVLMQMAEVEALRADNAQLIGVIAKIANLEYREAIDAARAAHGGKT